MADDGTLTRADLADIIHREIGLSRADSSNQVEGILRHMCEVAVARHQRQDFRFRQFYPAGQR